MNSLWPRRSSLVWWVLLSVPALTPTLSAAQTNVTPNTIVRCPIKVQSPLLVKSDLKDPVGLAIKIRDRRDHFSTFLLTQISPKTHSLLNQVTDGNTPAELSEALVEDLNRVLSGPSVFNPDRFVGM